MNTKRQRFVDAFTGEAAGNASKAAVIAGYSEKTAGQIGYALLKNVEVRQAVDAAQKQRSEQAGIASERILEEVSKIATAEVKVRAGDKMKALELLGKYRKLWDDKQQSSNAGITVNIGFIGAPQSQQPYIDVTATQTDVEIDRSRLLVAAHDDEPG